MATAVDLLAIVGPTASGKTSLALDIAERHNGEILCADSRTIYKGMDIGTAKPTPEEQARVPHWGLDLVNPGELFTAADFQRYANKAIADIRARGKLPLIVGGTGLYVDSVLYSFSFGSKADAAKRLELENMSIAELQQYCNVHNITLPTNEQNKRHLVRTIERVGISDIGRSELPQSTYIVGIATNMQTLRTRIIERSEHIFGENVENEATMLGKKYGWDSEAMTGNIYPIIRQYLDGRATLDQAKQAFCNRDWQLAKRQMTWFRRNPYIIWTVKEQGEQIIHSLLSTSN